MVIDSLGGLLARWMIKMASTASLTQSTGSCCAVCFHCWLERWRTDPDIDICISKCLERSVLSETCSLLDGDSFLD